MRLMKLRFVCVFLILSCFAVAQDAKVVELGQTDAADAKRLYEAKVAADKAWNVEYSKISGLYRDFPSGIEFSKDFRFIVPKTGGISSTPNGCGSYWPCYWSTCTMASPAATWNFSPTSTGILSIPPDFQTIAK